LRTWYGMDQAKEEVESFSKRAVGRLEELVVKNEFLVQLMLYLIHREK
jgi:hypothetical protein